MIMKIFLQFFVLVLIPGITLADPSILKWCQGDRILYSIDDLSAKGYTRCGELNTAKLCDAGGNRIIGNIKEHGAYKDCKIGPRISVIRHDPLPFYSSDDSFKYNDFEADSNQPEPKSPLQKVNNFKDAANSYMKDYDQYLKSLDAMIDGKQMPKEIEQNFLKSKENLSKATEAFPSF